MKKFNAALSLLALAVLYQAAALPGSASAAFNDSGWGVRPLGMAGAFTAVADDANAPLYNPAGITQVAKPESAFMSAKLFTGLDGVEIGQNYFSCIYPISPKSGNIGLTWASLYTPALYREDTMALSYARNLKGIADVTDSYVSAGVNLKYLNHEYTLDRRTERDPVFIAGSAAGSFSVDAGILASWKKTGVSVGLAGKNLNTPDVGLKSEDKVPNENVLGFAFYRDKLSALKLEYFTFALDLVSRDGYLNIRTGLESWFFGGKFATRVGFQPQELTMGLGYEFALWAKGGMILDYAFAVPLEVEKTSGTHRMGVTLKF
jgi:hypothetical protein